MAGGQGLQGLKVRPKPLDFELQACIL